METVTTPGARIKGGRSDHSVTGSTFLVSALLIDSWKVRSAREHSDYHQGNFIKAYIEGNQCTKSRSEDCLNLSVLAECHQTCL